jgi:hypothetical protein
VTTASLVVSSASHDVTTASQDVTTASHAEIPASHDVITAHLELLSVLDAEERRLDAQTPGFDVVGSMFEAEISVDLEQRSRSLREGSSDHT